MLLPVTMLRLVAFLIISWGTRVALFQRKGYPSSLRIVAIPKKEVFSTSNKANTISPTNTDTNYSVNTANTITIIVPNTANNPTSNTNVVGSKTPPVTSSLDAHGLKIQVETTWTPQDDRPKSFYSQIVMHDLEDYIQQRKIVYDSQLIRQVFPNLTDRINAQELNLAGVNNHQFALAVGNQRFDNGTTKVFFRCGGEKPSGNTKSYNHWNEFQYKLNALCMSSFSDKKIISGGELTGAAEADNIPVVVGNSWGKSISWSGQVMAHDKLPKGSQNIGICFDPIREHFYALSGAFLAGSSIWGSGICLSVSKNGGHSWRIVQCPVLKKEHLSKIGNGMSMYFDSPNDVFSCRDGKIRLLGRINVGTGIRKLFHARLGVDKREKSVKVLTAPEPVTVSDVDRKLPLCVYSSRMWDLPDFTAFSPSFYPREVSSENRKTNVRRIALFNTYDCNFKTSGPVKKKDVMAFRVGVPVYEGKEQELSADENFFPTKWRLLPGFPEYDTKRDHPWKGNGGDGMVRIRGSAGFPGKLELAQGNTHYEVPFSQLGSGSVGSPERVNPNLLFFRIRRWGLAYLETREVNSEVTVSVITLRDFGRVRALISRGGVLRAS